MHSVPCTEDGKCQGPWQMKGFGRFGEHTRGWRGCSLVRSGYRRDMDRTKSTCIGGSTSVLEVGRSLHFELDGSAKLLAFPTGPRTRRWGSQLVLGLQRGQGGEGEASLVSEPSPCHLAVSCTSRLQTVTKWVTYTVTHRGQCRGLRMKNFHV